MMASAGNTCVDIAPMRRVVGVGLAVLVGLMSPAQAGIPPTNIAPGPLPPKAADMTSVTFDNFSISSGSAALYQAGFESSKWSGKLRKFAISSHGDGSIQAAVVPDWDAAEILSGNAERAPVPLPEHRRIYTAQTVAGSGLVEFTWASLAPEQKALLNASPSGGTVDGLGARRVDYLRGVRGDEIGRPLGIFRRRDKVLGDIVNSNLVHVGAPDLNKAGADYHLFYEAHKNRTKAVYVGANDGMLHAFDASSGVELFAYVPRALIGMLSELSHPDYVHRPYVDGMIAVSEAQVNGRWKTVLAAGMGGGAQGLFALDVSNPSDFGKGAGALWEFTDSDDPDMGNVLNLPVIVRLTTRLVSGVPEYRDFVLTGSGLNNYVDDGHANSAGAAILFLLSLDKKSSEPWQLGVNYFKLKKPIADTSLPSGLSSPNVVLGADGAARYAYAGDLQGNLWRFDLTGFLPWLKENAGTAPMFTALDGAARRQPITTQPRIVLAPGGGYVILFGTGKLLEANDVKPGAYAIQSFYGVYDTAQKTYTVSGRGQLEPRTVSKGGESLEFAGNQFAYGEGAGKKRGWYFDFLASDKTGERSVSDPLVNSGRLLFNSLMPCSDVCPDGGGRSYVLDALTGLPTANAGTGTMSRVGMLTSPLMLQISNASSNRNALGVAVTRRKSVVVSAGSGGPKGSVVIGQGNAEAEAGLIETLLPAMRLSWREILNWQELRLTSGRK